MMLPRALAALAVGLAAFAASGAGAQEQGELPIEAADAGAIPTISVVVSPPALVHQLEPSDTVAEDGAPRPATVPPPPTPFLAPGAGAFGAPWVLPAGAAAFFLAAVCIFGLTLVPTGRPDSQLGSSSRRRFKASGGALTRLAERAGWLAESIISRVGRHTTLSRSLDAASVRLTPGEFVVLTVCAGLAGVAVGALLFHLFGALILGALGVVLPRLVVLHRQQKRRTAFAEQLDGTLQLLAGSLRAGYGLLQSVNTVAAEAAAPTAEEFGRIIVETRLGRDLVDSLTAMADRMDSEDSHWVAQAVNIQRSVGGDLAQILDTVGQTIRERSQIRRQVKALSAEGRFSAYILIALPFLLAGFMLVAAPDYLAPLVQTPAGKIALGVGATLIVVGVVWVRRLVRLWY